MKYRTLTRIDNHIERLDWFVPDNIPIDSITHHDIISRDPQESHVRHIVEVLS